MSEINENGIKDDLLSLNENYNKYQIKNIPLIKLKAKVVKGFGRGGKQLGCPTANMCPLDLGNELNELNTGIYFGWATVNGKGPYKAVTSIGWNPFYKNKVRIYFKLLDTFIIFKNSF